MIYRNIQDPITHQDYTRDPRYIARKADSYMRNTGLADQCLLPPELEFFVFDRVRFVQRGHECFYYVVSIEGTWNMGRDESPNLGYALGSGLGYFPCPPTDSLVDLRSEMAQRMADCGISTSAHFHEVATGGQCEIDLVPHPLVQSADQVVLAKYIIRNVARRAGKTATFMPKPLFGDNGSGMHTHLTLWKDDQPLLSGQGYAGLSDLGLLCNRRLAQARQVAVCLRQPHDQQLQAARSGFRGSHQDFIQQAQSGRDRARASRQPEPEKPSH